MTAESEARPAPEPTGATPSVTPQVDVTKLDDKHLRQYRHPNESRALVAIVIGLVVIVAVLWVARPLLVGTFDFLPTPVVQFLSTWLNPIRLVLVLLVLLGVMALMDILGQSSRTMQLVAQAVEVTPITFPQLAPIVDDLRTRFDLPQTRVYVSRDAPIPGYTIGVRAPHAIVFSSIGVGQLTPDEFKFTLGRQMGSITLSHTKLAVLMGNVNMSLPEPFSYLLKFRAVLFSSFHNAEALSCDRMGVVATRDVTPAISTLIKQNLGQVRGAKIDFKSLTPQTSELSQGIRGRMMRASMVLDPQPSAVARLAELVIWAGEPAETPPEASSEAPRRRRAATTSDSPSPGASAPSAAAETTAAPSTPSAATASETTASPAATSPAATASTPASPPAPTTAIPTAGTAAEGSAATAIAAPAAATEPTGKGITTPPVAATEGGTVSVTVSRPPQE